MTDYLTVEELKATLELSGTTYAEDDLSRAITAASRVVDDETGRRFYADQDATTVRYFTATSRTHIEIDDLAELTEFATDDDDDGVYETTWTVGTDFVFDPENAGEDGLPFDSIRVLRRGSYVLPLTRDGVRVTGKFGWAGVPENVKAATSILAAQLVRRMREAPFGIVALGLDGEAVRISRSDPHIQALLAPYQRRSKLLLV